MKLKGISFIIHPSEQKPDSDITECVAIFRSINYDCHMRKTEKEIINY